MSVQKGTAASTQKNIRHNHKKTRLEKNIIILLVSKGWDPQPLSPGILARRTHLSLCHRRRVITGGDRESFPPARARAGHHLGWTVCHSSLLGITEPRGRLPFWALPLDTWPLKKNTLEISTHLSGTTPLGLVQKSIQLWQYVSWGR